MPCPLLALPPQLILLMMISSLLPSMQAVLALALSATLSIILWLIVLFLKKTLQQKQLPSSPLSPLADPLQRISIW
jgi:hypothetical protein